MPPPHALVSVLSSGRFVLDEKSVSPADVANLIGAVQASYDTDMKEIKTEPLCAKIVAAFAHCPKINSVGRRPVYALPMGSLYTGVFLNSGGYNRVQEAELNQQRCVVRTTLRSPGRSIKTARMFLMESTIHAILYDVFPESIPRLLCVFKTRRVDDLDNALSVAVEWAGSNCMLDRVDTRDAYDREVLSYITSVVVMLQQMQDKLQFEHRDLRGDNIMVTSDPTMKDFATVKLPDGRVLRYPTFRTRIRIIDFGYSRITLPTGERLSCDVEQYVRRTAPSRGLDIAMLLVTLYEDCDQLHRACPTLYKLLTEWVKPIRDQLLRLIPKYEVMDEQSRWEALQVNAYSNIDNSECVPEKMLPRLAAAWKKITVGEIKATSS